MHFLRRAHWLGVSLLLTSAMGAQAASYDTATGLLALPSVVLAGSSSCYRVSLRTTASQPLSLEVLSAQPETCNNGEAAIYRATEGQLTVQALRLPDASCYDVSLLRVAEQPLRLQLTSALASDCSVTGIARPGVPQGLTAAPGNTAITLSFAAPSGGGPATGYAAACGDGQSAVAASGSGSPLVVTGLTNGRSYRCSVFATNASGGGTPAEPVTATPQGAASGLTLSSSLGSDGGVLPRDYTCDGTGSSPELSWSNVPAGTREFALLMTTLPRDGTLKWNWVLYNLDGGLRSLKKDAFGVGTLGVGSDGPMAAYQPPCSQGPGVKLYTWTLYALSAAPVVPTGKPVTGDVLTAALAPLTLATASLTLGHERSTTSGSSTACVNVRSSTLASTTGYPIVACDEQFAYVGSQALPSHTLMNGITATNLQVPVSQNFLGASGWKIPLNPQVAATTVSAVDGPIGVAINGVPIFNPCKQGGCQNGDTKVLGELDVCNGHAGRADDYHYHAAPVCVMAARPASYWATHPVGWALDGFAIFGYLDASGAPASRDSVCGGNTEPVSNAPAGYSYHVTDLSPYVLSCFRGTPGPDLAGQSAKFKPFRQPPVQPFAVSGMTLSKAADGYEELRFTSALNFNTTETGTDRYPNAPGTYRIRYRQLTGAELLAQLQQSKNSGKAACWAFQFTTDAGASTQPDVTYCR